MPKVFGIAIPDRFTFHTDPGHGWLEVPTPLLIKLGVLDKLSHYSYTSREGSRCFLEEDYDFGVFARAWKESGELLRVKATHTNYESPIRTLPRLTPGVKKVLVRDYSMPEAPVLQALFGGA